MATITGTLKTVTNADAAGMSITFYAKDTPKADNTNIVTGSALTLVADASGDLPSTTLIAGKYTCTLSNGESFDIDVPSGSGTHDISTIIDESGVETDTSTFLRRLFTMIADVAVTTQSATGLLSGSGEGTLACAANFFTQGKTLKLRVNGKYTTTGTPGTLTLRLRLTISTVVTLSITLPASMTDANLDIEGVLVCRTAGASGVIAGKLTARLGNSDDNTETVYYATDTAFSLDTTSSYVPTITAQFSAASQSLTSQFAWAEIAP